MRLRFALTFFVGLNVLLAQGGRGIPGLTEPQVMALTSMSEGLRPKIEALSKARTAMVEASFQEAANSDALRMNADNIKALEQQLAQARATSFAAVQGSPASLTPDQVAALRVAGGVLRGAPMGPQFPPGGTIPNISQAQVDALTQLTNELMPLIHSLADARSAVTAAALLEPKDIQAKVQSVRDAELTLANARATGFARIQASANKLTPEQVNVFADMGGSFANVAFTKPQPLNFADHEGYVSMFDGVSLKGWDGNPKFWRVEDGAIVGESTPQNPSGNSYLVYRDMVAKDFTLKFEIKVEGSGGSGFQYRSKIGVPWLANIPANVTANVGPVNLNWMLTGPQADFWPAAQYWTGQFYSENTPMRIEAWRGQVVEGSGLAKKQLMGNIGDIDALGKLVKMNDWNEYTVIARGGTFIQILNGQLMAVMVDDDPNSSNNQPGLFGIEIEATTKVSVRNIWAKKFD